MSNEKSTTIAPGLSITGSLNYTLQVCYTSLSRNLANQLSYRTGMAISTIYDVATIVTMGLMATFLSSPQLDSQVAIYGCDSYLQFLLIGLIARSLVFSFTINTQRIVSSRVFANLWISPCGLHTLVLSGSVAHWVWSLRSPIVHLLVAFLVFGVTLHFSPTFLLVVLLSMSIFTGINLIVSGFQIWTKSSANPVSLFLDITAGIITGTYFPITYLPNWLQQVSKIHPLTYVNQLARLSLGGGLNLGQLSQYIWPMLVSGLILLLIGILTFKWGFNKARKEGTIGHT
jgi:ABC-2 type transport system permease protein